MDLTPGFFFFFFLFFLGCQESREEKKKKVVVLGVLSPLMRAGRGVLINGGDRLNACTDGEIKAGAIVALFTKRKDKQPAGGSH